MADIAIHNCVDQMKEVRNFIKMIFLMINKSFVYPKWIKIEVLLGEFANVFELS